MAPDDPLTHNEPPPVSVIIPCLNDSATLGEVLTALSGQCYPAAQLQVLVVDNGSTDGSCDVARRHEVLLLQEPERSSYRARNRGIQAASGELLLFLDADTIPQADWCAEMVSCAYSSGSPMVGGRIENRICRRSMGSVLLAMTRSAEHRKQIVIKEKLLSGGNMLIARELFDRYGMFLPVRSGGDAEFARRANPEGRPIPYAEKAVVTHQCNISSLAYLGRSYRIARGQAQTRKAQGGRPGLPWRPGIRRALEMRRQFLVQHRQEGEGGTFMPLLGLRLFCMLWLDRWFFYCGSWAGRMRVRKVLPAGDQQG